MGRGGSGSGSGGSGGSGGAGNTGFGGCGRALILFVGIFFVLITLGVVLSTCTDNSEIAPSTIERTALPASAVHETGYYTDLDGDWIKRPDILEKGMHTFYHLTGVQPYLYILPNGTTTSITVLQGIAEQQYDHLFTDEAHFLLVFCDDGEGSYSCGYVVGTQAKTVMDSEAIGILADYIDRYYSDYSLREEEIFSNAFDSTANRIMNVEEPPYGTIIVVVLCITAIAVSVIVFFILKRRSEQRILEQKRMEEILKTPLEKFSDKEVEDLAKKYEGNSEQ